MEKYSKKQKTAFGSCDKFGKKGGTRKMVTTGATLKNVEFFGKYDCSFQRERRQV